LLRAERDAFAPQALIHVVSDNSVPRALCKQAARWNASMVVIGSAPSAPEDRAVIGKRGRQLLYESPFSVVIARHGLHEHDFTMRRIAVGYEGGIESQAALAAAAELARETGAELVVHTVVDSWLPFHIRKHAAAPDDLWESERQDALERAREAVSELGVAARVSATVGDPGSTLRDLSKAVDLIVVGSRRWGTFARLVAGSVGETLVADSGCSVMIVPRPAKGRRRPAAPRRGLPTAA
jgi:nucleotide-binding universal stress UspA family protein